MSYTSWVETYSAYTDAQLDEELGVLRKASVASHFSSQTVSGGGGSQGYTQDPKVLEEKLRAATRVKSMRTAGGHGREGFAGQVDLSAGVNGSPGSMGRPPGC